MGLFGSVPISCSELAKRLVAGVRARGLPEASDIPGNDTAWTDAVFATLREIGEGLGFKVFHRPPKGSKGGRSELLLDLIWYSEAGGVELGAECQWNDILGDDKRDIKKVVYVKCPLKVLLWWDETKSGSCGERIRREIESYLKKYNRHIRGEEYLCVEFGKGQRDRCDWYAVPDDGTVASVSLLPIQL